MFGNNTVATVIDGEFPFEEIKLQDSDYFFSAQEAMDAGYAENQVWSLIEGETMYVTGPSHHRINVIGYFATKETHDGNTYYQEEMENL